MFRVVPHKGPDGKVTPGKWEVVELRISGVVAEKRKHESGVALAVARESWRRLTSEQMDVNPEAVKL